MMITPRQNCSCEIVTQEAVKSLGALSRSIDSLRATS
jgi:hypothetical protein